MRILRMMVKGDPVMRDVHLEEKKKKNQIVADEKTPGQASSRRYS